ncbi:hypothetical protein BB561_006606, partial [Smittium simulii]
MWKTAICTLQNEGLADLVLDLITVNTKYYSTQKDFIDWRHNIGISGEITAPDIINYFSRIFIEKKLKQSTIKSYKSALLQLVIDKERILGSTNNLNTKKLTSKACWLLAVIGRLQYGFETTGTVYLTTTTSTNSLRNSDLKKRKVTLHEKKALALAGIKNQQRALKNQGLENYAVDFITLIKNLTSKLRWMLAVTGLLRSSNIYRINNTQKYITNDTLNQ